MRPSKERKKKFNAPLHKKRKNMNVHLSKDAKEKAKTKKRSLLGRKGDKVKVMKGKFKGKEAKIAKTDHKNGKVYLEGISKRSARGREMPVAFQPSNLLMLEIGERKTKKGE